MVRTDTPNCFAAFPVEIIGSSSIVPASYQRPGLSNGYVTSTANACLAFFLSADGAQVPRKCGARQVRPLQGNGPQILEHLIQ